MEIFDSNHTENFLNLIDDVSSLTQIHLNKKPARKISSLIYSLHKIMYREQISIDTYSIYILILFHNICKICTSRFFILLNIRAKQWAKKERDRRNRQINGQNSYKNSKKQISIQSTYNIALPLKFVK